ncbi:MAG: PQQ-like beta-propeller repeat protein [Pirellulaceae bacterium]|nr:PQQ-like beta-propeller repeat protein [Pirellulaceae bacterium]
MSPRTLRQLICGMLCVVFARDTAAQPAVASRELWTWPQHHGPDRTNISPETGLLRQWPAEGPRLVWQAAECGEGYSGVSIADGLVFTAGSVGDTEMVLALDLDGRVQWQTPSGPSWEAASPGSRATPTYYAGAVYLVNPQGRLSCFEAGTGHVRWTVDLVERFEARWGVWGLAENLIVDEGRVYCMPGGAQGRVVALDAQSGATIWTNTSIRDTAAYCSPTIITHGDVRQWVSMTQRSAVALDPATGDLLWEVPFVPRSPQNALTPVYGQGHVFVAAGHSSGGSLLKIADDSRSAAVVWHREDLDNCHSGSILLDGKLFGAACRQGGRHFYCVDFLTGESLQLDRTLGKVGLTSAEGMIYALGYEGTVSLLKVLPRGFKIVSQFELPRRPPNTYLAHPVVCGGRLYLRGDGKLWVYDIRDPSAG